MEIEDKSKLFVFDKKEVVLIFVFVIVITITAFTLGVRIGKSLSLKSAGYTKEDISKTVDLKSVEEESADKDLGDSSETGFEASLDGSGALDKAKAKLDSLSIDQRLENEFSKAAEGKHSDEEKKVEITSEEKEIMDTMNAMPSDINNEEPLYKDGDSNAGKFTIQLVSLETKEEAEKYAEPFVAANYVVVINKAIVAGKGVWYRVGIGLFDTHNEAKDYLEKEKSLFRGKNYLINQMQ